MDEDFSWFGGDDSYIDDSPPADSTWDVSNTDLNAPYTGYDSTSDYSGSGGVPTSNSTGTGGGGSTDWTKWLANAGLQAAAGYMQGSAAEKMSAQDFKNKEQLMKDTMAEQEKYYQAHGQQLKDAYAGYAKYYTPPTNHGKNNPTSIFGLLTPQTAAVQAVDGFPYDTPVQNTPAPVANYPTQQPLLAGYEGHSTRGY